MCHVARPRSGPTCSAATCTAVRPSRLRRLEGHCSCSSRRTASMRFHAAAQYRGVHPSRSVTAGGRCGGRGVVGDPRRGAPAALAHTQAGLKSSQRTPAATCRCLQRSRHPGLPRKPRPSDRRARAPCSRLHAGVSLQQGASPAAQPGPPCGQPHPASCTPAARAPVSRPGGPRLRPRGWALTPQRPAPPPRTPARPAPVSRPPAAEAAQRAGRATGVVTDR